MTVKELIEILNHYLPTKEVLISLNGFNYVPLQFVVSINSNLPLLVGTDFYLSINHLKKGEN